MLSSALKRLLDPTVVVEIWFCLTLSISEEVVKTKSIFSHLSSKTASKAELYASPLAETSAEVWRSGVASSVREPRRGRIGDPFVELYLGQGEHARNLGPAGGL